MILTQASQFWRSSWFASLRAMLFAGAVGRGVRGSGKSTKCYHWVPLYSHAWIASQPAGPRIGRWGCVEGARRGPARERGASLARRVSVGPQARACAGARCPVWSTQAASRTPRNPIQAERTQAEPRIRRVDRAWKSENGRTNPARIGWKEMHNLFCTMRFGRRTKTNWHLTTWTDCGKRTRAGSPVASDHARRREHC